MGNSALTANPNHNRVFRFALYELDGSTGELRKEGKSRPRLQGQPLEILLELLNRPGELVSREELRQRLWPADTFVDYDHSLNTAVNKVREALSDSAENPRFIQTIPRRGYRFIGTIEAGEGTRVPVVQAEGPKTAAEPARDPEMQNSAGLLSDPQDLPAAPRRLVRLLFLLIQAMYFSFYIASLVSLHETQRVVELMPEYSKWLFPVLLVTALVGIPVRLYLLAGAIFGYRGLTRRFLRLFPFVFPLDELWALSPFLIVELIGVGLALAATAVLVYVPFAQRSLLLMGEGDSKVK
jgi:DNA-binding winged helix-turn-helix (wHTH) protein